jgi:hypothetical protein
MRRISTSSVGIADFRLMEVNEKNDTDLKEEKNQPSEHSQQPSFHGPGFSQEAHVDSSTDALAAMASTFPPGLWNPPPGQSFGLGENSANAMMAGHQFSSFLGMLSAAAPTYAGAPSSGFMDCGAGFPGVNGSSLGAMMDHPFPRNQPLGSFQNDSEPSREMNVDDGCKGASLIGDTHHGDTESSHGADASNNELSRPECSGGAGQDERPRVSCAKKRKRSGQVLSPPLI